MDTRYSAPRQTPRAARIANAIMAVAGLTWVTLLVLRWRLGTLPWWTDVLLHGAEGALVGAACDWIAVSQIYASARKGFSELVGGVSRAVVQDMVRPGQLLQAPGASIRSLLETPAHVETIARWVREQMPSREALRAWLEGAWRRLGRPALVDRLVALDLRTALIGASGPGGLTANPTVRHAVQTCLRDALESPARTRELRELLCRTGRGVTVARALGIGSADEMRRVLDALYDSHVRVHLIGWLTSSDVRGALRGAGGGDLMSPPEVRSVVAHCLRQAAKDEGLAERASQLAWGIAKQKVFPEIPVPDFMLKKFLTPRMSPEAISEYLRRAAEEVAKPPAGGDSEAFHLVRDYAIAYLDGWHDLSEAQRLAAASRIHDAIKPLVVGGAADALWAAFRDEPLEDVLRAFITEEMLALRLGQLAEWLGKPAGSTSAPWTEAVRAYAGAWLDAWHRLPESVRREAAAGLIMAFEDRLLEFTTSLLWDLREEIANSRWEGRLTHLPWLRGLLDMVDRLEVPGPRVIDDALERLLRERLTSIGADEFAALLKDHTEDKLAEIQLNGARLGGALGLVAGGLSALAHMGH